MSSTSTTQIVHPARTLQGSVTLPGDKSISHRYATLAAIADDTTPLRLRHAIDFDTPTPRPQVKTAVLFAGLQAKGTTSLTESIRTRDHSEHALRAFGATLTRTNEKLSIPGGQRLKAIEATIPGDLSSAAFFLCAALLFPDSNLVLDSIGMNPTRASLLDVITALGG